VSPGDLLAWRARVDALSMAPARVRRASAPSAATAGATVDEAIAALWQDLLGVDAVSAADDFFELGGHSLIAVRLLNRIESQFGIRLPLAAVFDASTLGALTTLVRNTIAASSAAPERAEPAALRPVPRGAYRSSVGTLTSLEDEDA
jgi:acyl carrier protein